MLPTPAEFPHVGSTAWLRPQAKAEEPRQCRILRANHDGTRLIALSDRQPFQPGPSSGAATGNREVAADQLVATQAEALNLPRREALTPTRSSRAADRASVHPEHVEGRGRRVEGRTRQPDYARLGLGDPSERN